MDQQTSMIHFSLTPEEAKALAEELAWLLDQPGAVLSPILKSLEFNLLVVLADRAKREKQAG